MPDDDDEDRIPRRRKKHSFPYARVSLFGGVMLLMFVLGFAVGARTREGSQPNSAESSLGILGTSKDDWTYAELLAHLRKNGIPGLEMTRFGGGQLYAMQFPEEMQTVAEYQKSGIELTRFQFVATKMATSQDAREEAGRSERRSFAWGRWVFVGKPEILDVLKEALVKKVNVPDERRKIGPAVK